MYLLMKFTKGDRGQEVLCACREKQPLVDLARAVDAATGYIPGNGVWSQNAWGYLFVREVEVVEPGDVFSKFYAQVVKELKP